MDEGISIGGQAGDSEAAGDGDETGDGEGAGDGGSSVADIDIARVESTTPVDLAIRPNCGGGVGFGAFLTPFNRDVKIFGRGAKIQFINKLKNRYPCKP